jgi:hypothetical protein
MGIQLYALDEVRGALPECEKVDLGMHWRVVFDALDVPVEDPYNDPCYFLPGADMARRAMRALARPLEDEGTNDVRDWDPRRAPFVHFGRRPGFVRHNLEQVQVLAHRCSTNGWCVAWG